MAADLEKTEARKQREPKEAKAEPPSDDQNLEVLLGYAIIPRKKWLLQRHFFPSKIGGKPAWLDPQNLPTGHCQLKCHQCKNQPLTFILQVYACREDVADAFHRTIYIFGCLGCSNVFKALRCQLPRLNDFYSSEPPSLKEGTQRSAVVDDTVEKRCCMSCGIPMEEGASIDRKHDRCRKAEAWNGQIPVTLEEFELGVDVEQLATTSDSDLKEGEDGWAHELELLQSYRHEEERNPEATLDQSEQEAFAVLSKKHSRKGKTDPILKFFRKSFVLNPGHVIRYYRDYQFRADRQPLWFSSYKKPTDTELRKQIKPCENCGGPRSLEMQLSFGVLAVYSCQQSCSPLAACPSKYLSECVIWQPEPLYDEDFTSGC